MSNIRTFKDLERESSPNAQPLPNPWSASSGYVRPQGVDSSSIDLEYAQEGAQQYGVRIPGIDGNETEVVLPPSGWQRIGVMFCGSCFPCCIPPLWSAEKQKQYVGLAKSFSFVISLVQVIVFIAELSVGGIVSWQDNPSGGPDGHTLVDFGAKQPSLMKHDYEVWRFVTPIFLHAGIIHIAFNLLFQLRFGLICERRWGTIRYAILYFICGVAGNLMSCLIYYDTVSVGASTALMGALGAYCTDLLMKWRRSSPEVRSTTIYSTLFMVAFVLLFSFLGSTYIDGAGHLGGFLAGLLVGAVYCAGELEKHRTLVAVAALVGLTLYFATGFVLFYTVVPA